MNQHNKIKIATYNCLNFKANKIYIQSIIKKYDVCFFIEHWLNTKEQYLFNEICLDHHVIFHADYDNSETLRGRPHGGLCWVINKKISVKNFNIFNKNVTNITIEFEKNIFMLFGIWLPFNDNTNGSLALFQSSLSLISSQLNPTQPYIVLGDFNADTSQDRRFDNLLKDFINF